MAILSEVASELVSSLLMARLPSRSDEASLAQLVRAPGCGSGGRGFNPHSSPHNKYPGYILGFCLG